MPSRCDWITYFHRMMLNGSSWSSSPSNASTALRDYPLLLERCLRAVQTHQRFRRAWMIARIAFAAIPVLAFFDNSVLPVTVWRILLPLSMAGFVWAWLRDTQNSKALTLARKQRQLIEQEIRYLQQHQPPPYQLPGAPELTHHDYAPDLDLVGPHGLFHHLSRAQFEPTRALLLSWLLHPADLTTIQQRQAIAGQWATDPDWLIRFQAQGAVDPVSEEAMQRIRAWCTRGDLRHWQATGWRLLAILIPIVACGSVVAEWLDIIRFPTRNLVLLASGIIAYLIYRRTAAQHHSLGRLVQALRAIRDILPLLQEAPMPADAGSSYPADQRFRATSAQAQPAMAQLTRILEQFDLRYNVLVHPVLAVLFQWDLQQVIALQSWASKYQHQLVGWVDDLVEAEALVSLAAWRYHHPEYAEPKFSNSDTYLQADQLGHPLLGLDGGVRQSLHVSTAAPLMFITGSNMAGKSTFLRAVGINLVLAHAGAVVCAQRFVCQQLQLASSMRIADNLVESTSTFWAELKRIRRILELARSGQPVFILLDEILRGTNSHDQHRGTRALLEQLMRLHVPVLVASHDVALAQELHNAHPAIQLGYFDATLDEAGQLQFDYQLKPGICSSFNASTLMAQMGIDLGPA